MSEFDNEQSDAPIDLMSVFRSSIAYYKAEFKFFVSIALIYALLSEAGGFLIAKLNIPAEEQLLFRSLINVVLACWASIAIIYAASCLCKKRKFSLERALGLARQRYGLYLSVYLAMLCAIIFGFLLFILPGLYLMTIFLFADILVVVENASFTQAFQRSARMVKPYFWNVFAYLFIIVGISLTPEVIYQLGMQASVPMASALQKVLAVLIMPYLMIAQVALFIEIRSRFKFDLSSSDGSFGSGDQNE